jgi:hypothetical protein
MKNYLETVGWWTSEVLVSKGKKAMNSKELLPV